MRQMASIQKVIGKHDIEGADKIECLDILGWKVVARKGEFNVNDLVIYCEIDSLLPKAEWSNFLFDKSGQDFYRLKTIKLRGQISQGLVLQLSTLNGKKFSTDTRENPLYEWKEGRDVSELLGIIKWEPVIPACLAGIMKGNFPSFIPKTDEIRLQSAKDVLDEIKGKEVYISTKCDGSSCTIYFNKGMIGVCSRNTEYVEDDKNTFWKVAKKYCLHERLPSFGKNIAIQGECVGPKIQANRMALTEHDLKVFNIWDIDKQEYLNYYDMIKTCELLKLSTVPINKVTIWNEEIPLNNLLIMAEGFYEGTKTQREGIVIRPTQEQYSKALKGRMSFKVINNKYLLEGGE